VNISEPRIIVCVCCGGDRGHNDYDGRWHVCRACDGEGEIEIEVEPVTMEDLDA
jgi:hypothetical protein